MAIIKAINSKGTTGASNRSLETYLDKDLSVKTGIDCNAESWSDDFRLTKAVFDKAEGRQYLHFTQSFGKEDNLTDEQVNKIGLHLVSTCKQFKGFQAVVVTHNDKKHKHNHIVVNSVSSETGKKIQFSQSNLNTLKKNMEQYLEKEFNIKPTKAVNGIVKTQDTKTYQVIQKSLKGGCKSFTLDLTRDIKSSLEQSKSLEELTQNLSEKDITMNISEKHGTIMFTNADKKRVSSKKIKEIFGNDFSKEQLMDTLERNRELQELKKPTGIEEVMENDRVDQLEIQRKKELNKKLEREKELERQIKNEKDRGIGI